MLQRKSIKLKILKKIKRGDIVEVESCLARAELGAVGGK